MVSQSYVDGITGTVTRSFASSLTASQIGTAAGDPVSVSVICPDRRFPGDAAVVTGRDGRAFAGQVESMDVCGEVTIRLPLPGLPGRSSSNCTRQPRELRS